MKQYRRQPGVIQALQWTGQNKEDMRFFCPKSSFRMILEEEETDCKTLLYLMKEGEQVFVPKGDYVIQEEGEFYSYPRALFEKHYLVVGNPHQELCEAAIEQIKVVFERYQLNIQLNAYWDDEVECYFIDHDEEALETVLEGKVYEEIATILSDIFYSRHIYSACFGYSYELALKTGKLKCPHTTVEVVDSQNVGLIPYYYVICHECGVRVSDVVALDSVKEWLQSNAVQVVAGHQHLEDEEEDILEC